MAQTHSIMAEGVAVTRAVHQLIDSKPLIFEDPIAGRIIGAAGSARLREHLDTYRTNHGLLRARSSICVRSRFTEDELARAIAAGTAQYVILGAGLDTFAYRSDELRDRLTIYEVDEPVTQRWKHERLAEAGIAIPPNLRFVAVDFNEDMLARQLAEAGFDRQLPAFFSWLGVVYYLPVESIRKTLRFIARQAAQSAVTFDFAVAESAVPAELMYLFREFAAYNRTSREPWRTWFTPEEICALVRECGFTTVDYLDFRTIERRYLSGRPDSLLPSPLAGLIAAKN